MTAPNLKGPRIKIGANSPVIAAPDVSQQIDYAKQMANLQNAFSTAKQGSMEAVGALKAEYANTVAETNRQKLTELANIENASLARGMLGASATGEQYINLRGAAQAQVNAAANALRAGLSAQQIGMQQARNEYGIGKDTLELAQLQSALTNTMWGYSNGMYDNVPQGGGGGGPQDRARAGVQDGRFAPEVRRFVRGNAANPPAPGSSAAHALIKDIFQNFPEVYRYVQQKLSTRNGKIPVEESSTMEAARRLYKYVYAQNEYGE